MNKNKNVDFKKEDLRAGQKLARMQIVLIDKVLGLLKKYEETSKEQRLAGNEMVSKKGSLSDELWGKLKQYMEELKFRKKSYWMEIIKELEGNRKFLEDLTMNKNIWK